MLGCWEENDGSSWVDWRMESGSNLPLRELVTLIGRIRLDNCCGCCCGWYCCCGWVVDWLDVAEGVVDK